MSESSDITNRECSGGSSTILPSEEAAVENVDTGAEWSESLTAPAILTQGEQVGNTREKLTGDCSAQMDGVQSEQGLQKPAVETVGPEAEENHGLTNRPSPALEVTGPMTEEETGGRRTQTEGVRSEEGLQVCQESVSESSEDSAPPSPTLVSPSPSNLGSIGSNLEGCSSVNAEPETFSDTFTHVSSSPESHIPISPFLQSDSQGLEEFQQEREGSGLANKVAEAGKQAELPFDSELGAEQDAVGEGLRKRKVFPIGPLDDLGRESDEGDEDRPLRPRDGNEDGGGFTLNKCILGALLLLGMGTILFSGVFTDLDDEDVHVRDLSETEQQDSQVFQSTEADPLIGQEIEELMNKLAKENQQISELQAQLQAQKEELNLALQQAEQKGRESVRNGELEKENERMKETMSSLPALQSELESLRARVTELTLLTAKEESQEAAPTASVSPTSDQNQSDTPAPAVEEEAGATAEPNPGGNLEEELERQKVLLEGSRKRLEGMKMEGGGGQKGVREGLVEMERRLTEEVEKLGRRGGEKRNRPWEGRSERGEPREKWRAEKEAEGWRNEGRDEGRDWKEKQQRKEWRGEKDWKERGREGGKVWKEWEKRKEWKSGKEWKREKDDERSEGKEWKEERKERVGQKPWKTGGDGEGGQTGAKDWKMRDEAREKGLHKSWERRGNGWKEERKSGDGKKFNGHVYDPEGNGNGKEGVGEKMEAAKKDRHWQGSPDKTPLSPSHRHHEHNEYWKRKKEKLQHFYRPLVQCDGIEECAKMEGLNPVRLSDFEALLASYLSKIEAAGFSGGEEISKLVKDFFVDGVFTHDRISFRDFAEDVADILEDMVEVEGEDDDEVEDEMEEFEKDALRKFSLAGNAERDVRDEWKKGTGRVRG